MSVTSLRPVLRPNAQAVAQGTGLHHLHPPASETELFGVALLRAGRISAPDLMAALSKPQVRLVDHLITGGAMDEAAAYAALAAHWAVGLADFSRAPVDAALLARVDAAACLTGHWTPWRKLGGSVVIACAYPEDFAALHAKLAPIFGAVVLAVAPRRAIHAQVLARAGAALARRAETRLPSADSCRDFNPRALYAPLAMLFASLSAAVFAAPTRAAALVLGFAMLISLSQTALKLAAAIFALRAKPQPQPPSPLPSQTPAQAGLHLIAGDASLPTISIMIPLLRESRIVARLIRRLDRLDYPRAALEVIFLTEDSDSATALALSAIDLPPHMRAVIVPAGQIRTKPRALNYGLDHCRGQIIGVYDAEDAPAADQLRQVAATFATSAAHIACLQGRLDYYNPRRNWLSRCFTIEYANWWRIILPGLARMGFAIPLGGTTLFFRRDALVQLGGWDAHNVTEDADLGLRLARSGYQTQLLDSTTHEEANAHALSWIKQRSRWIKGYIMTYASHMRSPRALLRDLGPWRFLGMQMMFAGSVLQALLAPLLQALWLIPLGLIDISSFGLPAWTAHLASLGLFAEGLLLIAAYIGMRRTGHGLNPLWLLAMTPYNFLASLAAYKAVYEVLTKPFFWDKTAHGLFDE